MVMTILRAGARRFSAVLLAIFVASVQVSAAPLETALDGVTLNGFLSVGYTYNTNKPIADVNGFRVFDVDVNSIDLDVVELVVQKPVTNPGDAGFRVDMVMGDNIPTATASIGLALGDVYDVQQAYASYIVKVGSGLRLDIGKHVTHMGAEVIEGYDGWNDNYSRSLSFNYGIPFTHTGVKASYTFADWLSATGYVVNGWDSVNDNNNDKSLAASVMISPISKLHVILNWMGGPEQANNNDDDRNIYQAIATWEPFDDWKFVGDFLIGNEDRASAVVAGQDAEWQAITGYAIWNVTDRIKLALRAERFEDEGGTRLGVTLPTDITSFTLTPEYKVSENFSIRIEGRVDEANRNIFVKDNNVAVDNQTTIAANALYHF